MDDSIIALISGISLFLFQANNQEGKKEKIMNWEDAVKLPWGILLLFGGGLAIAQGFQSSGLANWIAENLTQLNGFSLFIILLVVITAVNFLTEITSNLATTAMLLTDISSYSSYTWSAPVRTNGWCNIGCFVCLHATGSNTSKCCSFWI